MDKIDNVSLHRAGNLGIMKVRFGQNLEFCDTYPVYPERPGLVTSVGPVYRPNDETLVATGLQMQEGGFRNVAWFVQVDEAEEIRKNFAEAVAKGTFEII